MRPDVGAAASGIVIHADDRTDGMILKSGSEDLGRAIGQGVDQQSGAAMIDLAEAIRVVRLRSTAVRW